MRALSFTLTSSLLVVGSACSGSSPESTNTTATGTTTGSGSTTLDPFTTGADTDGEAEPACSVTRNDCPGGNKCTVVSTAAGEREYVCVPILGDDRPGDACEIETGDGRDSCAAGSVCVGDPPDTTRCVAFCGADGTCAVDTTCVYMAPDDPIGEGLPLCLGECNPLQAPCPDDWACHEDPGSKRWYCAPRLGGQQGGYGSPCDSLQLGLCAPGFACLASYSVASEECSDPITPELGCCAQLCDLAGDFACPGQGEECLPFYPETPPPGLANLGVCALPEGS